MQYAFGQIKIIYRSLLSYWISFNNGNIRFFKLWNCSFFLKTLGGIVWLYKTRKASDSYPGFSHLYLLSIQDIQIVSGLY